MGQYQAQFLTHGNRVFGREHFDAETDGHAIEHARQRYRSGIGKGYEIWDGDRHVHTEVFPPSLSSDITDLHDRFLVA